MDVRQRVIGKVVAQFVHPRGLIGRLVGWEMALRPSNRRRNRWAVELLEVERTDRVLEVGFGPGIAIRSLARLASEGLVCGIDHSFAMVRQATARNRAAVRRGQVDLRQGCSSEISALSAGFDKALVVNNLGMWPEPEQGLVDLRGVMRPGGRVAIVSQPRGPGASAERTREIAHATTEQLGAAGFSRIRTEMLDLRPPVACVLAEVSADESSAAAPRGGRR